VGMLLNGGVYCTNTGSPSFVAGRMKKHVLTHLR